MVVTHREEILPIDSHYLSIRWFCGVTWQIKYLYLHLQKTYGHQTKQGAD